MKMPETYWEERIVVLEGLVELMMKTLVAYQPAMSPSLNELHNKWGEIINELDTEYEGKK